MKDILLGIITLALAGGMLAYDKVSLGYMSPNFEGFQKYLLVGLLIAAGFFQIYHGYKKR